MSDTALTGNGTPPTRFERGTGTNTNTPLRLRLKEAIDRRLAAEQRLHSLEEAGTRAHSELRDAEHRLDTSADLLRSAERDENSRLAYQYLNNPDGELADPISSAKAHVSAAQADVSRLEKVETALAEEVRKVQASLNLLRTAQYSVMAELVCSSNEFQALVAAHTQAYINLRSIKYALRLITAALGGQAPQRWADEWLRNEPLEHDRMGFPVDADLIGAWSFALSELVENADAVLPSTV